MTTWSIEQYCAEQEANLDEWSDLPKSSQDFLQLLGLPALHPFCLTFRNDFDSYYIPEIPRQGPLQTSMHENVWEWIVTIATMAVPSLRAMCELWLRLFAGAITPVGIAVLIGCVLLNARPADSDSISSFRRNLSIACILTVASSLVLMTDTLYVLAFGSQVGLTSYGTAILLSLVVCEKYNLPRPTRLVIQFLFLLAGYLIYDPQQGGDWSQRWTFGDPSDHVEFSPSSLYFDSRNSRVNEIVRAWDPDNYSYEDKATPWMPTGDALTGLPFLMNKAAQPAYTRVWLPVRDQDVGEHAEFVALDIAFPSAGHDGSKPLFLCLHGLNGGSTEEYVRDFVWRQNMQNSTVVVMVARGLMDTPIRGWNMFHGARWTDAHEASIALRRATLPEQALVGVGYSMGAIVLSNTVVRAGNSSVLDGAVAISGGLDMRAQETFSRAQRLWQPMLCKELRQAFLRKGQPHVISFWNCIASASSLTLCLVGKWGERVRQRVSHRTFMHMLRATHITEIDESVVVEYNGFHDLIDYYKQMSALGDVSMEEFATQIAPHRRIHQLAVPLLVVHSLDDPLITWKTVAANQGARHPSNLTTTGEGNLMLLLTKAGGHVGWPVGVFPSSNTWYWMNNVASSFAYSVQSTMGAASTAD